MHDDKVDQMLKELRDALDALELFRSKTFMIFEVEDFKNKTDSLYFPAAGVGYVGATSIDSDKNKGRVANVNFVVFYAVDLGSLGPDASAMSQGITGPLFEGRQTLGGLVSEVSKRPFVWGGESIFGLIGGVAVYQQQWSNRVMFT